jgi:hypothetical protein
MFPEASMVNVFNPYTKKRIVAELVTVDAALMFFTKYAKRHDKQNF